MKLLQICYPGFVKKALTFSMDDGKLDYDGMLLDILRPAGILGTFNLSRTSDATAQEYRELYRGYEIANHCKHHPFVFVDDASYDVSGDAFDSETADPEHIYRSPSLEGIYLIRKPQGWRHITDPDNYVRFIREGHRELEAVFGNGSIQGFAWPFNEQNSQKVKDYLSGCGYLHVRRSGLVKDDTSFDLPQSLIGWRCNANQANLGELLEKYANYPDDGRLKFFAFGVHSIDYHKAEKWRELRELANRYGARPNEIWYATVGEIFRYSEAAKRLAVSGNTVSNTSDVTLYIMSGSERITLLPGRELEL